MGLRCNLAKQLPDFQAALLKITSVGVPSDAALETEAHSTSRHISLIEVWLICSHFDPHPQWV